MKFGEPVVKIVLPGGLGVFPIQLPTQGIGGNVIAYPIQCFLVAYNVFVKTSLPKGHAGCLPVNINLFAGNCFECSH